MPVEDVGFCVGSRLLCWVCHEFARNSCKRRSSEALNESSESLKNRSRFRSFIKLFLWKCLQIVEIKLPVHTWHDLHSHASFHNICSQSIAQKIAVIKADSCKASHTKPISMKARVQKNRFSFPTRKISRESILLDWKALKPNDTRLRRLCNDQVACKANGRKKMEQNRSQE